MSVLSAECLDLSVPDSARAWRPLEPLPTWHNGSAAPVVGGNLFLPVAYGADTDKTYWPRGDRWLGWAGEPGREPRDRPGVAALANSIYVVGGAVGRELVGLVERWDGEVWSRVAPLAVPREGPGCVAHGGKLWVIGGRGSGGTVECYCPDTDTWQLLEMKVGSPSVLYCDVMY